MTSLVENESHLFSLFTLVQTFIGRWFDIQQCSQNYSIYSSDTENFYAGGFQFEELRHHMKEWTRHVLNWWKIACMLPTFRRELIFIECLLRALPYARQYPIILVTTLWDLYCSLYFIVEETEPHKKMTELASDKDRIPSQAQTEGYRK